MLQIFMQFKYGIAIAGTHGKTTTTSMVFDILNQNKSNPTVINGGLIKSINSYAKLGLSNYFITEADESDQSFLHLKPNIAILTNIESDHINHYNNNFTLLKKTFLKFLNQIPSKGIVIICIDDHVIQEILPEIQCQVITYGFSKNADFRIVYYKQHLFTGYFQVIQYNQKNLKITLNIPGKHNALNATAALALASIQKISNENILETFKHFSGTYRRFEYLGKFYIRTHHLINKKFLLIDDYGHHPTELLKNIQTIRLSWPKKKLIMIFQPHRYTRTHSLYNDFIKVLSQVDILLILNVYSANESIIPGANSFSLYKEIKKNKKIKTILVTNKNLIFKFLAPLLSGNDIVLLQGAGNIEKLAKKFFLKNKK